MIVDLTLSVSEQLIDEYLEKQENRILAQGHIGTHLDTYIKSDIPMEYFKRNGVIIDAEKIAEQEEIGMKAVENIDIKEGDFVVVRTGRIEKYKYGTREYFENHPVLTNELIDYFISKKVSFIGVDCAGIRRNGTEHQDADKLCEENGIYVIENMTELDKLLNEKFTVYTMWLDDKKATGLRCRVLAETK